MPQKNIIASTIVIALLLCGTQAMCENSKPAKAPDKCEDGWISLFDGKTLDGWKVSEENPKTFTVKDGMIIAKGPRAHLFYAGKVCGHNFKDFELKIDVMTKPNSNGGVYFHTEYQKKGWPGKGFEVQVNNTHKDPKKSGGLYGVKDVFKAPAKDGQWFTEHIIVKGKQITIKVDGKTLVEFTEPTPPKIKGGRVLSSGTFALQGHDPGSTVCYKNIRVKVAGQEPAEEGFIQLFDGKSFKGWKISTDNPKTFTIADGAIVAKGPRAHLFYDGKVGKPGPGKFKNFELKIDVMTKKGSNGGVYFHTAYQKSGWPAKGFEVQVNNTHRDPKKSGGLYAVKDVFKAPAQDDKWFTEHIIVKGKKITIKVDGKTTVEFTEPTPPKPPRGMDGRFLSAGTFALQGHDPKSVVYYKNIRVKILDD